MKISLVKHGKEKFHSEEFLSINSSREKRLAKKYYDKLFKEYCICDLSHWQEKKIAMRWRIDKEVVSGKGKFISRAFEWDEHRVHFRSIYM